MQQMQVIFNYLISHSDIESFDPSCEAFLYIIIFGWLQDRHRRQNSRCKIWLCKISHWKSGWVRNFAQLFSCRFLAVQNIHLPCARFCRTCKFSCLARARICTAHIFDHADYLLHLLSARIWINFKTKDPTAT